MPRPEHLVLCGGVREARGGRVSSQARPARRYPNVRLRISDISRPLLANIPDVLVDLLEVASYVYAADSAISRGGKTEAKHGRVVEERFSVSSYRSAIRTCGRRVRLCPPLLRR